MNEEQDNYSQLTMHESKAGKPRGVVMLRLNFLGSNKAFLINPYEIKSILPREDGNGSTLYIKSSASKDIFYAITQDHEDVVEILELAGGRII